MALMLLGCTDADAPKSPTGTGKDVSKGGGAAPTAPVPNPAKKSKNNLTPGEATRAD